MLDGKIEIMDMKYLGVYIQQMVGIILLLFVLT